MSITLLPEIKKITEESGGVKKYLKKLIVGGIAYEMVLPVLFSFNYRKSLTVWDGVLLFFPYASIFSFLYLVKKGVLNEYGNLLFCFLALNGALILFPLFFAFYHIP